MKYFFLLTISIINITLAEGSDSCLNNTYFKERMLLEREAYKILERSKMFNQFDSCKIKFIYYFDLESLNPFEINDNNYLKKVEPFYCFRYRILFNKIQVRKRLRAIGFVFDKHNILLAKIISSNGHPFKFDKYINSDYYYSRVKVFEKFDFVFYLNNINFINEIWCVKRNETFIYNIEKAEYVLLKDYYLQSDFNSNFRKLNRNN